MLIHDDSRSTESNLFMYNEFNFDMCLGNRGLEIEGKFVKFTAIGVYLEESAIPFLADKWKGKSSEELEHSVEFFRDIVTGIC